MAAPVRAVFVDSGDVPVARNALERMDAAIPELEARPRHQVFDRVGHQDLAALRQSGHARANVDGDPTQLGANHFALAGVDTGTNVEAKPSDALGHGARSADRTRRTVEGRQEAVTGGVDLASAIPRELAADDVVVRPEEVGPAAIAELGRPTGRVDDVGEEYRSQHAVGVGRLPHSRHELLDLVHDRVARVAPRQVIDAVELDVLRSRDVGTEEAAGTDVDRTIRRRVQNQRGYPDDGQDVADIDLVVHTRERRRRGGAGAHAEEFGPPLAGALVVVRRRPSYVEAHRRAPFAQARLDPRRLSLG